MKNKTKKIIKLLIAILLIVAIQMMGYTYGKYLTKETGTGQAEIAKWGFEIVKDGEQTKTVKLTNTASLNKTASGKIAPGTKGTILISLDASAAEVDLDYSLKFSNERNKPNNIKFTYSGVTYKTLSEISTIKGTIKHDATEKVKDIQITWEWPYETGLTDTEISANDELDIQDANNITEYTFDITATGTQSN